MSADTLVGVISDTHGLLRPEAAAALAGVSLILHAGDVGRPDVLDRLADIAPVRAVRGNVDVGPWAEGLPADDVITVAGRRLYLVHNVADRDPDRSAGCDAVVFGHSHKPESTVVDDMLWFNPGSAGPRRFRLPVVLGFLRIGPRGVTGAVRDLLG